MRRIVILVSVLLTFLASAAWGQQAQSTIKPNLKVVKPLVLYDDFKGPRIDPAKWDDFTASARLREAVREISPSYRGEITTRRLRIFQRAYSWTGDNEGVDYGWLGLQVTNPALITEISFDVLVNSAAISECQSNPSYGSAWAGFAGRFFNYAGQLNDGAGDVEADINLYREGTDARAPLRVQATYEALDGTANEYQTLGFVSLGQTTKLRIKWDQPNHQFIFQLNRDPEVFMVYSIPDTSPPFVPIKTLWVVRGTPHCAPPSPLGSEMMDAYFANVMVNMANIVPPSAE